VLVLTTYADDESRFPALQAGARGYLTKDASAEEIEQAIRAVAEGRTHLDPKIQDRLVVSAATVKTHVNRVFYKTGARDRAQAVRYAYQRGLV
jgi:DNA-binding NarL/FixJ family response regulator